MPSKVSTQDFNLISTKCDTMTIYISDCLYLCAIHMPFTEHEAVQTPLIMYLFSRTIACDIYC